MESLRHRNKVAEYISKNYPDWDFKNFKKREVEICDNGDVHYNSFTIIKTGIKL